MTDETKPAADLKGHEKAHALHHNSPRTGAELAEIKALLGHHEAEGDESAAG